MKGYPITPRVYPKFEMDKPKHSGIPGSILVLQPPTQDTLPYGDRVLPRQHSQGGTLAYLHVYLLKLVIKTYKEIMASSENNTLLQ